MFKQVFLPIILVAAFIAIVGYFTQNPSRLNFLSSFGGQSTSATQKTVTIDGKVIAVSIADTNSTRTKGLSGTKSLDQNSGMLFIFDTGGDASTKQVTPLFWMKDMLIPLDIIWISGGKIVHIDKSVPIPAAGTADTSLQTYSAGAPVDYVLEVNAGFCDQNNIKVGDNVNLSGI